MAAMFALAMSNMINIPNKSTAQVEKCMKPMFDYNKNSSYQASVNDASNELLLQSARTISKTFEEEFNVADFGCSHGKNSMVCFKAALDGLAVKSHHEPLVTAYFNDLPTNDFSQVLDLLLDKSSSITEHDLFQKKGGSLSTCINGKSFYSRCFPRDHLHLAFSFFCLHWMESPRALANSIVTKSQFVTKEEASRLAKDANQELHKFLMHRATEMKTGGHLVITLPKDSNMHDWIDILWKKYLKKHGYKHSQFSQVFIPAYHRSDSEIQIALEQVKTKWRPVVKTVHDNSGANFSPAILRAATFNLILDGVVASGIFSTLESATTFTEEFYNSLGSDWDNVRNATHMLVLERI